MHRFKVEKMGCGGCAKSVTRAVLGIEPNAFGAIGAIVNFAVALGVSAVTKAPPAEVRELVEHIRVPAGAEAALDH